MVAIDSFTTLSDKRPSSLYRIFVSFIHQIISQRPSLFRPIQNLMAEILRQEAWTEMTLETLLLSIFRHSHPQNMDFLVLVNDFEGWPSEVRDWLSKIHTLFDDPMEPRGSSCTLIVSCLGPHSDLGSGQPFHLDLAEHHQRYSSDMIRATLDSLAHSGNTGPTVETVLSDDIISRIISKAKSFDGPLTGTGEYLTQMFRTIAPISRIVMEEAIDSTPATAELLYRRRLERLAQESPMALDWAEKVLSWVLRAARPLLHVEELAVAVAIDKTQSQIFQIY